MHTNNIQLIDITGFSVDNNSTVDHRNDASIYTSGNDVISLVDPIALYDKLLQYYLSFTYSSYVYLFKYFTDVRLIARYPSQHAPNRKQQSAKCVHTQHSAIIPISTAPDDHYLTRVGCIKLVDIRIALEFYHFPSCQIEVVESV